MAGRESVERGSPPLSNPLVPMALPYARSAAAFVAAALLLAAPPALAQFPTTTVPVGDRPVGVGVDPVLGQAYVANSDSDNVTVLDVATASVVRTVPVGGGPLELAVDRTRGRVYVLNRDDRTVSVIDGASNTVVGTVPVGNLPITVAVDLGSGRVAVANSLDDTVTIIDGVSASVVATLPVGDAPNVVAIDRLSGRAVVTNQIGSTVTVLDVRSATVVATIPVGTFPSSVVVDETAGRAFVGHLSSTDVTVIDVSAAAIVTTVPIAGTVADLEVIPGGGAVVVLGTSELAVVEAATATKTAAFPASRSILEDIAVDGSGRVFITDSAGGAVEVVDRSTGNLVATVPVGRSPSRLALDPSSGRVVVSNTADGTATIIRPGGNVAPVPQGIADGQVFDIAYDPATERITGTIAFSFLSPEAGQTTTISSPDFDRSGDYDDEFDEVDADAILTTTDGNPATGEIEVFLSAGIGILGGDVFDVTLVACDDGPDGGACTEVTVTIRVDFFPTRDCEPGFWYVFGFDADGDGEGALASGSGGDGEYVLVYANGPGPLDLSGCTFVAFDPFTERVVLTADLDGVVLGPFADTVVLDGGVDFAEGSIPDGPGAIAFVQGDAAVGDPVSSVLGRVAYALVYVDDETLFGVFPAGSPLPSARAGGGAGDLAAALAAVREGAAFGPAFAVGPNPVRGAGTVAFRLGAAAAVRVAVYDVLGREVAVLADGVLGAGEHRLALDASALPAGAYVVRLVAGGAAQTARLTVAR